MADVTRQKLDAPRLLSAASRASRTEAHYRALFDSLSDGIIVCDRDGRFLDANPAATALLDSTREETPEREHPKELGASAARAMADLAHSNAGAREIEVRRSDGSVVVVEARAATIPSLSGRAQITILHDVTEQRQAERERERLREEWLSMVAHDLRQPVTVISGYARLLGLGLIDEVEGIARAVEHIGDATLTLNRMIEDLLDVSRIELQQLHLRRQPVDLATLLQAVIEKTRDVSEQREIQLTVDGPIHPLDADQSRVEQVLTNLLSNAVKYGDASRPIDVSLQSDDKAAIVSVRNYGPGIPPDEQPFVFSRFGRSRQATEGNIPGLGLGLYIAKGIVEAHGGQIWVESVPGDATTFSFTLPWPDRSVPSG
jgi:PAS domain S-box-containing protein